MGYLKTACLLVSFFSASACTTVETSKYTSEWLKLKSSVAYQKEKALFKKRIGSRDFCWGTGLDDFLKSSSPQPNSNCLYPTSKFIVDPSGGFILTKNILRQNLKQLKVLQITSEGFVVQGRSYLDDKVIFVRKTHETGMVDGGFLDETQNWQVYEYAGTYTYSTLVGSKTVHSFKRLSKNIIDNASQGLKLYSATSDFFIENQLWDYLGEPPKR